MSQVFFYNLGFNITTEAITVYMYTLTHIKTFIKVVERNNFSAAARDMELTVAAVSKHVSQLETELNVQLMSRTTRKLTLTDIGHQYYLQCKNVLRAIDKADAVISQTQDEPNGTLRVKSERYFAERCIIPKLKDYMEAYPKVQIDFSSGERVPDLVKEKFDIVFGRSLQQTDNIIEKTITTTHFSLCASPAYIEKHGCPKTPRDLINHQYLSHSTRIPNDLLQFGKHGHVYIMPTMLINDSEALLKMALEDMGFVKLQHYVVADAIDKGLLVEILNDYKSLNIPINVFYQPEKLLQTKVKTFIDFICADLPEVM